jgi:hypothetical protein
LYRVEETFDAPSDSQDTFEGVLRRMNWPVKWAVRLLSVERFECERFGWSLRRRLLLLLGAALVLVVLFAYPSFFACRVSTDQLGVSKMSTFIVPVAEGYAVGFNFTVANLSSCKLTVESITVHLLKATYSNETVSAPNITEVESLLTIIEPSQSAGFSYSFDSYFEWKPISLLLRVELTFAGSGAITVFEGDVDYSS